MHQSRKPGKIDGPLVSIMLRRETAIIIVHVTPEPQSRDERLPRHRQCKPGKDHPLSLFMAEIG